jgi:hypothetical protein
MKESGTKWIPCILEPDESSRESRKNWARATGPQKTPEYSIDYSVSQLRTSDKWLYIDLEYPEAYPA